MQPADPDFFYAFRALIFFFTAHHTFPLATASDAP